MLSEISATQLGDWMNYAQLEPFGEQRADWRQQMICAVVANGYRDPKKKALKLSDFALKFGGGQSPMGKKIAESPKGMAAQMQLWDQMSGATVEPSRTRSPI